MINKATASSNTSTVTRPSRVRKLKSFLTHFGRPLLNAPSILILGFICFSIFIVIYFTSLTLSWTGLRYDVILRSSYLEIVGSYPESSKTFASLKPGDRIVALDDKPISQLISDKNAWEKISFYPAEDNQKEITAPGDGLRQPYPLDQTILLFSVKAKTITFDFSHRPGNGDENSGLAGSSVLSNTTSTTLPFKEGGNGGCPCEILLENNSGFLNPLVKLDLTHLQAASDEILTTLILAFLALFICLLGAFFYIVRPSPVTAIFALFNVAVPIELIGANLFQSHLRTFEHIVLVSNAGMLGVLFLHFILLFPNRRSISRPGWLVLGTLYVFSISFVVARVYFVAFASPTPANYSAEHLIRRINYLGVIVAFLIGLSVLLRRYFTTVGQERLRLKVAVLSIVCASVVPLLAVVYYLLVSLWQPVIYNNFGLFLLSNIIIPPGLGYAVIKNELLGVSLIVRRSVVHIVLTLISVVIFIFLSTVLTVLVPVWKGISENPVPNALILASLTVTLYQLFQLKVQRFIDNVFNVTPLDYSRLGQQWSERLVRMSELPVIVKRVIEELPRDYHYRSAALLLCSPVFDQMKPASFELKDGEAAKASTPAAQAFVSGLLLTDKATIEQNKEGLKGHNLRDIHFPRMNVEKLFDPNLHSIASSLRLLMSVPMLVRNIYSSPTGKVEEVGENELQGLDLEVARLALEFIQHSNYVQLENDTLPEVVQTAFAPLRKLDYHVAIPLVVGAECYGVLLLGRKTSDYFPTEEELNHLNSIAGQIAVAFYNSALLSYAFALAEAELSLRQIYEFAMSHEELTREEERLKLSEALHGGILQLLHQLDRNLNQMISDWAANHPMRSVARDNPRILEQAIESLRNINQELMPMHVEKHPVAELHKLFDNYQNNNPGILFSFLVDPAQEEVIEKLLPRDLKFFLFRTVQEAATNAIKHARARNIKAELKLEVVLGDEEYDEDEENEDSTGIQTYQLEVRVSDDGIGLDPALIQAQNFANLIKNNHFGLANIKLRVESYKGEVKFCSEPGQGLEVICSFLLSSEPGSARIGFDDFFRSHASRLSLEV